MSTNVIHKEVEMFMYTWKLNNYVKMSKSKIGGHKLIESLNRAK